MVFLVFINSVLGGTFSSSLIFINRVTLSLSSSFPIGTEPHPWDQGDLGGAPGDLHLMARGLES